MAIYTAIAAGGNWSSNVTWGGTGHPVAGDTAIIDATMVGTVTVDAAAACAVLNCTNNGGTLAFGNYQITVTGNVTLGGALTAGTGGLKITGASNMTSNAITFPGAVQFAYNGTVVLVDNWVITGLMSSTTNAITINRTDSTHGNISVAGGLTITQGMAGTSVITMTGGIWSGAGGSGLKNSLIFAGNVTVSGSVAYADGTITYTSGTITVSGSTLSIGDSCTLNTNGMTWNTVLGKFSLTITLTSNLACGILVNASPRVTTLTGADVTCTDLYNYVGGGYVFQAGMTVNVTHGIVFNGQKPYTGSYQTSMVSGTPSTHAHLVFSGAAADCQVYDAVITDIDASGSAQVIDSWYSEALTRVTNITNRTSADIGGSAASWFGGE